MSAPAHLPGPRTTAPDTRLHWWALALLALAFGLLLLLLAGSGQAHAATDEGNALLQVTHQLLRAVG